MADKKIRFLVADESTLCYTIPDYPYPGFAHVLASKVFHIRDCDLISIKGRNTRPATVQDFERFRIVVDGYLKDTERYENIPAV
jgi:hypothetical protein